MKKVLGITSIIIGILFFVFTQIELTKIDTSICVSGPRYLQAFCRLGVQGIEMPQLSFWSVFGTTIIMTLGIMLLIPFEKGEK